MSAVGPRRAPTVVYHVDFSPPSTGHYRLDTPDPSKVGPWIADMFGLFPWHPSWPSQPVTITTSIVHSE